MSLFGKEIFFLCLTCTLFLLASTEKEFPLREKVKTNTKQLRKLIGLKVGNQLEKILKKIDRLSQKIHACATREEVERLSEQYNSRLDRIQKRYELCHANPCLNGGRCELTATASDYECTNCPNYVGKQCETFKCGNANACFERNNVGYFVFESSAHVTWEEAMSKCLSEGMSLAQPKDNKTTELIKNELRQKYNVTSPQGPWFWIGFRYDANNQQWNWLDGSGMGRYNGDNTAQPINKCGQIYLHEYWSKQLWSVHDCTRTVDNRMHSLCQKPLF